MTIEYSESIVVKDMPSGIPVTLLVECLDVPKGVLIDAFTGIYLHSVLGELDIKTRKEYDKALKDSLDFSTIKSQPGMLYMNLSDAKKLVNVLNRAIKYGDALEELGKHR